MLMLIIKQDDRFDEKKNKIWGEKLKRRFWEKREDWGEKEKIWEEKEKILGANRNK